MYTVTQLLASSGVHYRRLPGSLDGVFLTAGNQLIGTYAALRRYQAFNHQHYFGWDAHHVVEAQDLARLGVQHHVPPYNEQICVLIPPHRTFEPFERRIPKLQSDGYGCHPQRFKARLLGCL